MSKVTGTVEKVFERKGWYSVNVDGTWYGTGLKHQAGMDDAPCQEGDDVEFEMETNGKFKNIVKGSLIIKKPESNSNSNQSSGGSPDYDLKQRQIIIQASQKVAAELVKDMVGTGVLKLPAKQADKFEAYLGYFEAIVGRLAFDAYTAAVDPGALMGDIGNTDSEEVTEDSDL